MMCWAMASVAPARSPHHHSGVTYQVRAFAALVPRRLFTDAAQGTLCERGMGPLPASPKGGVLGRNAEADCALSLRE